MWFAVFIAAVAIAVGMLWHFQKQQPWHTDDLRAVNFHFLRQCNYACKYCFHQDNQPRTKPFKTEDWQTALRMLHEAGMRKINFSGGEPFLKAKLLGQMVRFCKEELNVVTGVISNGSLIKEAWMQEYGRYLDWLGISLDSFDPETLVNIGRKSKGASQPDVDRDRLKQIRSWCNSHHIRFKINTVVSRFNHSEDMVNNIMELQPERWKVFQALAIEGENVGPTVKRNAADSLISPEEFNAFVERHQRANPITESNTVMRNSYVIVDERLRFLNNGGGQKQPGPCILQVGVKAAFRHTKFEDDKFRERQGDAAIIAKAEPQIGDIEDLLRDRKTQFVQPSRAS